MKIYKTQEEVERDIKNGSLSIEGDVIFECSISVFSHIKVSGNITARNINAWNITAGDITAGDISYYAFCCVYQNIKCCSIQARRISNQEPICLDGGLTIEASKKVETIEIGGIKYDRSEVEAKLKDIRPIK
jgi:cytoskeletal protein CcmA (bactofilin family)